MLPKVLWLAGLLTSAVTVMAKPTVRFGCGTPEPTEEDLANTRVLAALEGEAARSGVMASFANIVVPTYFHVVAGSTSLADGYLTDKMLNDQLDVINSDFAPLGISFSLQGITRTVNTRWSRDQDELQMKQSLRRGDYKTLNVYFVRDLGGNLGYCYFPTTASPGSTAFIRDGCTVHFDTVPGGGFTGYNLGKTATHEIGHWFNLYHTFQGGCTGSGDQIADTPAQSSPSSGCPRGRDSCPNHAGLDPIHNYMDYSNDACYEEFTQGQRVRMHSAWNTLRV
ncbi:hypothetical protein ACRALDRAFT_1064497 [Sodiomyces alcalophilus JCM 7366]|uniref:uncharacterized protein n=1 Tax=Sodiomyces alcalophilus JCM 7366 TaxID=591952 RepID=UPI0039B596FC